MSPRFKTAWRLPIPGTMLNWLSRYTPVQEHLLDDGRLGGSLLDIGCGPHGFSCVAPDARFTGLDVLYHTRPVPSMTAVKSAPGRLPFADGAFASVVCLDVLEHVPQPDRAGLVAELARVAAERVIVACPNEGGLAIDDFFRRLLPLLGHGPQTWLDEHREMGLPTEAEIEGYVRAVDGFTPTPLPMPNWLLSTLLAIGDIVGPDPEASAREAVTHRDEWIRLCSDARFGESYRAAWILERAAPLPAIVDVDCSPSSLAAALRCPSCAAAFTALGDDLLLCDGCGRVAPFAAGGWWDLDAAQFAPLGTDPERTWFAEPTWERDELAALLAAFGAAARHDDALVLYASPTRITGPDAADRLQRALAAEPVPVRCELIVVDEPLAPAQLSQLRACRRLSGGQAERR